jgi:protein phosphatase
MLGDILSLCTDGLTTFVEDQEILIIAAGNSPQAAADKLVDLANERGGNDNITVLIAMVK